MLIIFQSLGIRFFDGQGALFSILIILLSISSFQKIQTKDIRFFVLITMFLIFNKIYNEFSFSFNDLLLQISYIIGSYLLLIQYRTLKSNQLVEDFFVALEFFCIHALIGYIIYLLTPNNFTPISGTLNKSFYYLFYVSASDFAGIKRNTGLFWEPGIFQLVANLYLFYCIKFKLGLFKIISSILLVLTSFSTTGIILIIVCLVYLFHQKIKNKKKIIITISIIVLMVMPLLPFLYSNISDKFSSENTSGLVRMRDFYLGIQLIIEKPFLGHGLFDNNYLIEKGYTGEIENSIFSNEYLKETGEMGGGYTNGLLGMFISYGIPLGLITFYFLFRNKFSGPKIFEKVLFSSLIINSMFAEPIFHTPFILMFPLSYYILKNRSNIQI